MNFFLVFVRTWHKLLRNVKTINEASNINSAFSLRFQSVKSIITLYSDLLREHANLNRVSKTLPFMEAGRITFPYVFLLKLIPVFFNPLIRADGLRCSPKQSVSQAEQGRNVSFPTNRSETRWRSSSIYEKWLIKAFKKWEEQKYYVLHFIFYKSFILMTVDWAQVLCHPTYECPVTGGHLTERWLYSKVANLRFTCNTAYKTVQLNDMWLLCKFIRHWGVKCELSNLLSLLFFFYWC